MALTPTLRRQIHPSAHKVDGTARGACRARGNRRRRRRAFVTLSVGCDCRILDCCVMFYIRSESIQASKKVEQKELEQQQQQQQQQVSIFSRILIHVFNLQLFFCENKNRKVERRIAAVAFTRAEKQCGVC
jgi:hypothetical protein